MSEKVLIMLKPDVVNQNLALPIILSLNKKHGLNIESISVNEFTKDQALNFYQNSHDARIEKLEKEKDSLSQEEYQQKLSSFDEINDRNSNFISSGPVISLVVNNKTNLEVRNIVENELRDLYTNNHDTFGRACNGIHCSDSSEAFDRDYNNLKQTEKENRNLNTIWSIELCPPKIYEKLMGVGDVKKLEQQQRNIDYLKNQYVSAFNETVSSSKFSDITKEPEGKYIKYILSGYSSLLNNWANNPNMTNSIVLQQANSFIINGVNENSYQVKNEEQKKLYSNLKDVMSLMLEKSPEIKKVIESISRKVDQQIDSEIGKHRGIHRHIATNIPFKQKNSVEMDV